MTKLILLITFLVNFSLAQFETQEEKEMETINFSELKEVIKDDFLEPVVNEKIEKVRTIKKVRKKKRIDRYHYPLEKEFWTFMSEYWLIKNASTLKWDFKKPDYGLDASMERVMESLGMYQKKFRILPLNTPVLTHMALPADDDETIFLISVPFMRSLDLTKVEISLLLLEDYYRIQMGFFKKNLKVSGVDKWYGKNFYKKKVELKYLDDLLNAYSILAFEKGFSFQQQYEVTKKMDLMLKSNQKLWNAYFQLLNKIDKLVKMNLLYNNYNKIYPSPEMQIKWLSPKEKVL
jgi:hypothetical protein